MSFAEHWLDSYVCERGLAWLQTRFDTQLIYNFVSILFKKRLASYNLVFVLVLEVISKVTLITAAS